MHYRKLIGVLVAALMAASLAFPAQASHNKDDHSDNVKLLAEKAIIVTPDDPDTEENEEVRAAGSDLAFQKNLLVAGSYSGTGFFKILPKAPYLQQLSFFNCPGGQGDVSVWGDLVFVSIDGPRDKPECDSGGATTGQTLTRADWEGVRIMSIKDIKNPQQIAAVETDCGSHTHTLVPGPKNKLYIYVESYPISGQSSDCNAVTHRKISVIEVPLNDPAKAKVISTPSLTTTIGCHDITVFPERDIAVAACVSESQVWDIKNPADPKILAKIYNPLMQIHHSTGITWDGKILVLGDEFGGAAAGGCTGNSDIPMGAMWFYDISDPKNPKEIGYYAPPRVFERPSEGEEATRPRCTTHNFNILPMKNNKKYIATVSYYSVALSVIDFSDPSNVKEIGYYLPKENGTNPDSWSAYWYNGRIYTNDHGSTSDTGPIKANPGAGAGVRAFEMKGLGKKEVHFFRQRLNPQTQIR